MDVKDKKLNNKSKKKENNLSQKIDVKIKKEDAKYGFFSQKVKL